MLTTLRVISKSPPKKRAQNAQQPHDKRKHNAKEWQLHRCLSRNTAVQPRNRPWEISPEIGRAACREREKTRERDRVREGKNVAQRRGRSEEPRPHDMTPCSC